jgi:hypothetical protein
MNYFNHEISIIICEKRDELVSETLRDKLNLAYLTTKHEVNFVLQMRFKLVDVSQICIVIIFRHFILATNKKKYSTKF